MKKLTQELKAGKMALIDVPCPTIGDNEILLKNNILQLVKELNLKL